MQMFGGKFCSSKIWYNSMAKSYLDGSKQMILATKPVFRAPGWERAELVTQNSCAHPDSSQNMASAELAAGKIIEAVEMSVWELEREEERQADNLARTLRRARVKVRDYALSTPMTWFVTLTLDKTKVDRYDVDAMTLRLKVWLDNLVRRNGLAYVMVPELHGDGAIHYHALMTDSLEYVDSGTIIPRGEDRPRRPRSDQQRSAWLRHGGRIVYNLPEWPYGYTTALRIEGYYERAVTYVSKYISKGHDLERAPRKVGGRWYYHGGNLGLPEVTYCDADYEAICALAGSAAHRVDVSARLPGVEMVVIWQRPDGVLK